MTHGRLHPSVHRSGGWALLIAFGCAWGCSSEGKKSAPPAIVTVFAASSLTDVLEEAERLFESRTGTAVRLNLASSSALARQIESGAACDLFISAHGRWMDEIQSRGLLREGTRQDLMANRLVLIAPKGQAFPVRFEEGFVLADAFAGRIATANPDHVPAGEYARQALTSLGWWDSLKDRLTPTKDVRATLALVETGEVDAGIVYTTDAAASRRVDVLAVFPQETHERIAYPAALCRDAGPPAEAFLAWLLGPEAAGLLERYGFIPISR